MTLTLNRLQREQAEWARRNFGEQPWEDPFLGLVEELGELAHALLKQKQGIRGTYSEHEEEGKDAVGDFLIYLANFCTQRGWDLQSIIEDTWSKVKQRDWAKDPLAGGQ